MIIFKKINTDLFESLFLLYLCLLSSNFKLKVMNIFVLDYDTKTCAQMHCDKHCVKMILETAQLLCGVHHMINPTSTLQVPYKLSHRNHPCSIWSRECLENYVWLCDLGIELCKEYIHRYGKRHKSQDIIEWCMINLPMLNENGDITPFRLAMPDECKIVGESVDSYRKYYIMYKKDFCKWTNREIPFWFTPVNDSLTPHQLTMSELIND
jgi:hypothetical protein